jgi:putative NADH-flavin reductase
MMDIVGIPLKESLMKIAIIGASGFVGSAVLKEALDRGHQVTALVRNPEKITLRHPNLSVQKGDVLNEAQTAPLLTGHDAVISAYNPGWKTPDLYNLQVKAYHSIINAVKKSGVRRLLVVGGAGGLEISPGKQLVDTPDFPEEWKGGALAMRDVLGILRQEQELEWTYLSPSMMLVPGPRTGKFHLGGDQLLTDGKGESKISIEDYAMALIDELEHPRHLRKRFTVGY